MNFNIKEFNIDSIGSSEKKTNLLPSIPKSSSGPPSMDLSTNDLFGLDSIMNKSKAKKSPSPTSMSTGGGIKSPPPNFSSTPSFKAPSTPPGLSNINKLGSLDLDLSPSKPSSPGELKSVGSSLFSKPSIPGLSSSNTIPDLDKEIKSLEKGLNDDMAKVNQMKSGMNSPQLPNFGSSTTLPQQNRVFTPMNNDPDSIVNLSYEEIQKRKMKLLVILINLETKVLRL
jgi:hypothetical protein